MSALLFFTGKSDRPCTSLLSRLQYHTSEQVWNPSHQGSGLPTWVLVSLPLLMWLGRAQIWKRCHFHQEQTQGCTWLCPGHFSSGPAMPLALCPAVGKGQNTVWLVIKNTNADFQQHVCASGLTRVRYVSLTVITEGRLLGSEKAVKKEMRHIGESLVKTTFLKRAKHFFPFVNWIFSVKCHSPNSINQYWLPGETYDEKTCNSIKALNTFVD